MERRWQNCEACTISADEALFIAMEDARTARFLRAFFSRPEQKPEIVTERWMRKQNSCQFWEVAIIEKPLSAPRPTLAPLNIAHILVDALDGKILGRWYLKSVFYEEYQEFKRIAGFLPESCKDRNR
jgi:hypothetical protein